MCIRDGSQVPVERPRLEVGFGGGEHLLHRSGEDPACGFIGVEPFVNGMAKLLSALEDAPRDNLRLYDDDATLLLDWLPDAWPFYTSPSPPDRT